MTNAPKQEVLLEAAIELFAQDGFWNTTTARIAKHAGVATGTLFTYFPSKNDLIDAVYRQIKGEMLEVANQQVSLTAELQDVLFAMYQGLLEWSRAHPVRFRVLQQLRQGNLVSQRIQEAVFEDWRPLWEVMQQAQQSGVLIQQDLELLLQLLWSHWEAVSLHVIQQGFSAQQTRELGQSTFPMIWRAIASPQISTTRTLHEKDSALE